MKTSHVRLLLVGAAFSALSTGAMAQTAPADTGSLNEIVVTALPGNPLAKIKSSVSISTLKADAIAQSAPSSAADIIRDIPGFRSEASGGEGNANVSARGLPLAAGGSKYVQWQENGLPVFQFGDMDFATPDQFVRADYNTDRVEAIRGGSASTAVSDAPGGVINFIDKDGKHAGGAFGITTGLDYDETRYDFDYGAPVSDTTRFHIGGFYNNGQGLRDTGFDTVSGGQIKFNVTHDIDGGFIKFNFKFLDDKTPSTGAQPVLLSGNKVSNFPGFSAGSGTDLSPYMQSDTAIDANGKAITTPLANGYDSKETSFGGEFNKDVGDGWKIDDKFDISHISGGFTGWQSQNVQLTSAGLAQALVGQYPDNPYIMSQLGLSTIKCNGNTTVVSNTAASCATPYQSSGVFTIADGPQKGQVYTGAAQEMALFDVTLPDVGNYFNDLKVSKTFNDVAGGSASFQAGLYNSRQNINEDWHWNTYLSQVKGKDAALLSLTDSNNGTSLPITDSNGVFAYGQTPAYGGCCDRYYDVHYTATAPYVSASWQNDKLNLDGSLRYDIASASGTYGGNTGVQTVNVNNTATLTTPDHAVGVVNTYYPLQYTKKYLSYSFGANYEFNPDLAVFARTSEGGRFNAERLLFGGGVAQSGPSIGSTSLDDAVNEVYQTEGGVKYKTHGFSLFLTGFYAVTTETNADFTNQTEQFLNDTYHAKGVEAEVTYTWNDFSFHGGATYTDASIVKSADAPANVGHVPQRQADWVYQFTPIYKHGPIDFGLNVIGTTDAYTGNDNKTVMPGYVEVNLFADYDITDHLKASIAGNNIFNAIGITEWDGNNTARAINGETFRGSLKYSF